MLLTKKIFFVKERTAILKLTDIYDIFDPETGNQIGIAKEEPNPFVKYLRLLMKKGMLPTLVNVYENETKPPVFSIKKHFSVFRSKVEIFNDKNICIGYFKSKFLTIGGGFWVYDTSNNQIAEIKGDWKGWNFKFINSSGKEIGTVTKKWAGMGKELFTSADNYIINIADTLMDKDKSNTLLLAAGLSIDIIFKEGN